MAYLRSRELLKSYKNPINILISNHYGKSDMNLTMSNLIENRTISKPMSDFLIKAAKNNVSILLTGLPGTGKKVMMKAIVPHVVGQSLLGYGIQGAENYYQGIHFCHQVNLESTPTSHTSPLEKILEHKPDYVLVDDEYSLIDDCELRCDTSDIHKVAWEKLAQLMNSTGVISTVDLDIPGYSPEYAKTIISSGNLLEIAPIVDNPYLVMVLECEAESNNNHRVTSMHEVISGVSEWEEPFPGIFYPLERKTAINTLYSYSALEDKHYSVNSPSSLLSRLLSVEK